MYVNLRKTQLSVHYQEKKREKNTTNKQIIKGVSRESNKCVSKNIRAKKILKSD
jgi:hypothetical protein